MRKYYRLDLKAGIFVYWEKGYFTISIGISNNDVWILRLGVRVSSPIVGMKWGFYGSKAFRSLMLFLNGVKFYVILPKFMKKLIPDTRMKTK